MPTLLTNYHYLTQSQDQADGTVVQLTVARAAAPPSGLLYDLTLMRDGDPLAGLESDDWIEHVTSLQ